MEIKPTHVTFEQAKLLKEKGFNIPCNRHCFIGNTGKIVFETSVHCIDWGNRPLTKTIQKYSAPEQWQVIEWLRVKHGIHIVAFPELLNGEKVRYYPSVFEGGIGEDIEEYFDTPQEATSAAIDYVLNNLI